MIRPTMTLAEVVNDLRSLGMKIKENTLSDGIASGVFPFGKIISTGETGRRSFLIIRADYEHWKANALLGRAADLCTQAPISQGDWDLISSRSYTQEDKDIMWEVIIRSWAKKQ